MTEIKKENFTVLPRCIGTFDGDDLFCVDDDCKCRYANVCLALTIRVENKDEKLSDCLLPTKDKNGQMYCTPKNIKKFTERILSTLYVYGIIDGTVTLNPKKKVKDKKVTRELKPRSKNSIALDKYTTRWLEHVSKSVGFEINRDPSTAKVNDFFLVDKRDSSAYMSLYYKFKKNKNIPIVLFRYRPKQSKGSDIGRINVEFPFLVKDYSFVGKDSYKKLSPVDKKRGAFLSVCHHLDEEGVMISADVCIKAIDIKLIDLPYLEF